MKVYQRIFDPPFVLRISPPEWHDGDRIMDENADSLVDFLSEK